MLRNFVLGPVHTNAFSKTYLYMPVQTKTTENGSFQKRQPSMSNSPVGEPAYERSGDGRRLP